MRHDPVCLEEVTEYLAIDPEGVYVDCTLGAAGYAERILSRLQGGRLIAIDRDETAIDRARVRLAAYGGKVEFVHGGFAEIAEKVEPGVAGVAADLGWSRDQVEDPERGFSFQYDGPLDARFDRRQDLTAGDIVNFYDERELANLFYELGGERRSRGIARAIVRGRPIRSTRHLAEIIERAVPRARDQKLHPATKCFAALRIATNDEMGQLDRLLETAPPLLRPGGRMVVVSFHSLEDGRVKRAFRRWAAEGPYEVLTKKVVTPSQEEVDRNPASRSAKLRALRRVA
ncbi:MAG: 16S rRNA (cytosine(1402)-N(4))-methyltransferase RsmH [Acidobacteria bacterium]|nr:16S rRNA (cytosine(1402)-N(4))-methyltransferase RsmH [Acidobacteriota bacterium]